MANPIQVTFNNSDIESIFPGYPPAIFNKLLLLSRLVFKSAYELGLDVIEETLKWGEPGCLTAR